MILYRLSKWFKTSDLFQGIILFSVILTSMLYSFLLLSEFNSYKYVIKSNDITVNSDTTLVDVSEYVINTDGSLDVSLIDGSTYSTNNYEIVFISKTSEDRCYFSKEYSTLICEISEDFQLNFLIGGNYFMVLIFSFLWLVLVYMLRKRDYSLLSKEYVLWFVMFAFVILSFSGVLIMTNFEVLYVAV